MPDKLIKPLKPRPQIVYITAPPKPAWRYWANLAIVAGAILGCIVCFLSLTM